MALTIQRIEHKASGDTIEVEGHADGDVSLSYDPACPSLPFVNLNMSADEATETASALLMAALAVKQHQAETPFSGVVYTVPAGQLDMVTNPIPGATYWEMEGGGPVRAWRYDGKDGWVGVLRSVEVPK